MRYLYSVLALSFMTTAAFATVCDADFKRPSYPSRATFCSTGEMVEDSYNPGSFFPCEQMEIDHFISLRYAYDNGVCSANELKRLANDPDNLRLTHWKVNRSKAAMAPEEFAMKRLSPDVAEEVLQDARRVRSSYSSLAKFDVTPSTQMRWMFEARDDLTRRLTSLEQMAPTLRDEMVEYRGKRVKAREAVADYSSRIRMITKNSALRNAGSMAGEALPYVGMAVIVSVTAMELKDACDTLVAAHELEAAFNPEAALSDDVNTVCAIEVPTKEQLVTIVAEAPDTAWGKAKEYASDLPNLTDVDIDWRGYFEAAKVNAVWLVSETGSTVSDLVDAAKAVWGRLIASHFWGGSEEL